MNPWTTFTKRVTVHAPIETIYRAWATQDGIESWFLRLSEYKSPQRKIRHRNELAQKGDTYKWLWHGYPDSVVENREVVEANGKDTFAFMFSGNCKVTVSIKKEKGETICELKQENIPIDTNPATNLYIGCGEGWTFYLANLKSILEGGIDLRNKNENLQKVINS